jgi:ankyrin repeat protein
MVTDKPTQQELDAFFDDAAAGGDSGHVTEFLDKYPSAVDEKNGGTTAMVWAALYGRTATIRFLLEHGANVNETNEHGTTALMEAAENGYKDLVELLLDKGADIDAKNNKGKTALMLAEKHKQPGTAGQLVRWAEKQKRLQEERQAQWLKDTSFSGGLKAPIPAPRTLKLPPRGM